MDNKTGQAAKQIEATQAPAEISIDASHIPSAVLTRLIEEVRHEHQNQIAAYNRTHNRHNRGR
jgi:hypothetical protein